MNSAEFSKEFDRLVGCFSIDKPRDKANSYFEYLEDFPHYVFEAAVTTWIETEGRFPSVAQLRMACNAKRPETVQTDCQIGCNGRGLVTIGIETYRSNCEHGKFAPVFIALAPRSQEIALTNQRQEFETLYGKKWVERSNLTPSSKDPMEQEILWARAITSSPDRFIKGFKFISPLLRKANPELYGRVRQILIDVLGKDEAVKLWKRATGTISNQTISQISVKENGRETKGESNGHYESSNSTVPTFESPVNQNQGEAYV